jgi:dihydroxy-acid dehydratase
MSGTGFGTVVLHVSPEAFIGGNLAIVRNGDPITLDVKNKILCVEISEEEIGERRKKIKPMQQAAGRGYTWLFRQHVEQAHLGADLDFLKGGSGSEVLKDSH